MPAAPSPQRSAGVPENGSAGGPLSGLCGAIFDAGDPKPEIPGAPLSARSGPEGPDGPPGTCEDAPLGADEAAEHPVAARLTAIATVIAPAASRGRRPRPRLSP